MAAHRSEEQIARFVEQWAQRALAFGDRLAGLPRVHVEEKFREPGLSEKEIRGLERSLGRPLPPGLAVLLRFSRYAGVYYETDDRKFIGGPAWGPPDEIETYPQEVRSYGADEPFADQRAIQEAAVPFIFLGNGDKVAVVREDDSAVDPPVAYISFTGMSFEFSDSFTDFLTHWERAFFVGPESWMIERFMNDRGVLQPTDWQLEVFQPYFGETDARP